MKMNIILACFWLIATLYLMAVNDGTIEYNLALCVSIICSQIFSAAINSGKDN